MDGPLPDQCAAQLGADVITTGACLAIGLGAEWWLRRRGSGEAENNDMLSMTFEFVGIAYAILAGFVIVSVWETQQAARQSISIEAATLQDFLALDHVLSPNDRAELELAVTTYVRAVVDDEFEELKDGGHAESAKQAADGIFHAIADMTATSDVQSDVQSSMIDSFKQLSDVRTERQQLANSRIAGELWLLVLVSSLAMILLVAAFKGEGHWDIYATAIISVTIGLVLFAMVALSYPFSGDVSIDSAPIRDVLHTIARSQS